MVGAVGHFTMQAMDSTNHIISEVQWPVNLKGSEIDSIAAQVSMWLGGGGGGGWTPLYLPLHIQCGIQEKRLLIMFEMEYLIMLKTN